jgi:hypothetical protein
MAEIYLWAGLNWNSANEDEVDGGGLNPALDVGPVDASEVGRPLVENALVWASVHATPVHELRLVTVARENRIMKVAPS